MSSFFKKAKVASDVEDGHVDALGGGGGKIPSGVVPAKITAMYGITSDKGALSVQVEAVVTDGEHKDRKIYNRLYCVNASGETFYEREGKKRHYAGFLIADAIALCATEGELGLTDLEEEERTVKVREDGKEVQKRVPMFVDCIGAEINVGLVLANKYKQVNQDGTYIDSDEVIQINEWDHIFDAEGFTVKELLEEVEEPVFIEQWIERWEGKEKALPAKKAAKSAGAAGKRERASSSDRASKSTSAGRQRRGFINNN